MSTTTTGLWNSTENLSFPSVGCNTTLAFTDHPISFESKTTTSIDTQTSLLLPKLIKNSSTSTAEDFIKEENSNSLSSTSSQTKKNINWSVTGGDFDDSLNLFDSDVKMEFYTAETQTDFSENLFNNNYTQTTFADLYDFEKFDIQTQTNWDEWRRAEWFTLLVDSLFINKFNYSILDTVKYFLAKKLVRNKNPDDDSVAVLQEKNEMRVHDIKREVERPHLVEDGVTNI